MWKNGWNRRAKEISDEIEVVGAIVKYLSIDIEKMIRWVYKTTS